MKTDKNKSEGSRLPILQGVLPIKDAQVPAEIIAGITLAALAVPEVMGYTKISGTPLITGLYTILIPMALFAFFGSSRHLVVGADSATAAILAAGMVDLVAYNLMMNQLYSELAIKNKTKDRVNWGLLALFAIDKRHKYSFRYFMTGSPFEYEFVRKVYQVYRKFLIES